MFARVPEKQWGILMIVTSAFCFALMNVCIRLAGEIPTVQKVLFRNLIAMFVAAGVLLRSGGSFLPSHRRNVVPLFCRAGFGLLGMVCNFYAVDHLMMSDASMLMKMAPFFAVIFSAVLLKEKLKPVQLAILALAFGGAMCIVKPTLSNMALVPAVVGFCGGMMAGLAYTLVRFLTQRGEKGSYIVFFFSAFSCVVLLPAALANWQPLVPYQVLALLGTGLCAAGGQFSVTAAYRFAPAREISVYDYSQVVFSAIFGFALFGDLPDALSAVGYVLIIGMAVLNFCYNNRKAA